MTSPFTVPRVVHAVEIAECPGERERAIGFARLQVNLVQRHLLADGIAARQALLDAEASAEHKRGKT